ncbi:type VI secretion system baseplate subunit TssG [Nereida sp. MMG025]|uniref:type VI secretion system baseplate subunit TssG n=1 Tax=Nereida sp. MMG025 TaxID=2909981 RepID=UPI001F025405|nr:type VI secretion system baseplate subunit TssG [Nereida sp. MMG025]MCF6445708.1 type VI secretion system baseplate subunit TssG [Nereida sp. MMG025]
MTEANDKPQKRWSFLQAMRLVERRGQSKPRIGQSARVAQDIVEMGQDPYTGFASDEVSQMDLDAAPPKIRPRFLGFYGPFGPLPHAMTREVDRWVRRGDRAFVKFTDIFTVRFQQLFYRSWSDARPITQFDHPSGGNFPSLLRSLTGDASAHLAEKSPVDDIIRLRYTALAMGRVRSPVKLRQILSAHFSIPIRIDEFVTSWLEFDEEDRSILGAQGMGLGQDFRIGKRAPSISEKIIVHIECRTIKEYRSYLPGRDRQAELKDLILAYLGPFYEVDVALWLPHAKLAPMQLGKITELGWTSAFQISKAPSAGTDAVRATQYQISMENA